MSELIFFLVGLLLGGCVSFLVMACLQINRLYETEKEGNPREKKND